MKNIIQQLSEAMAGDTSGQKMHLNEKTQN